MRVTRFTKEALVARRQAKNLTAKGYELIGESGHPLWELQRGGRWDHRIVDAIISADGKSVFIKIERRGN